MERKMKDLLAKVKEIKDWDSRKLSTFGTEDLSIYNAEAVSHADVCNNCEVGGGCNDTHPMCRLRSEYGIRATGEIIAKDTPIEREFAAINSANSEKVIIPVNQEALF